jgi:hypothetical protein
MAWVQLGKGKSNYSCIILLLKVGRYLRIVGFWLLDIVDGVDVSAS